MKKIIATLGFACLACVMVFGSASNKTVRTTDLMKNNIESQTANAACLCECLGAWGCNLCPNPSCGFGSWGLEFLD